MATPPRYFDVRSDFWEKVWGQAESYASYLANSPTDKAERWVEMASKIPALTDEQAERIRHIDRRVNVLMYTGVWCGDCVRQGPMLKNIADVSHHHVELRCIDREANVELRDELRICGAMRVPVVVFLTDDFLELGRFGDRMLTVYRRKARNEVGAACPVPYAVPPEDELTAEQNEWLDVFERMLLLARTSPHLRARFGD